MLSSLFLPFCSADSNFLWKHLTIPDGADKSIHGIVHKGCVDPPAAYVLSTWQLCLTFTAGKVKVRSVWVHMSATESGEREQRVIRWKWTRKGSVGWRHRDGREGEGDAEEATKPLSHICVSHWGALMCKTWLHCQPWRVCCMFYHGCGCIDSLILPTAADMQLLFLYIDLKPKPLLSLAWPAWICVWIFWRIRQVLRCNSAKWRSGNWAPTGLSLKLDVNNSNPDWKHVSGIKVRYPAGVPGCLTTKDTTLISPEEMSLTDR